MLANAIVSYFRHKNPIVFEYVIDGITFERPQTCIDLGVMFDTKFTFYPHLEGLILCTKKTLGFLICNCKIFSNITIIKLLYNSK